MTDFEYLKIRLWLDDFRQMPDNFDVWVKNPSHAMSIIKTNEVSFISFDHDLGYNQTGYDVAKYIEMGAYMNILNPIGWEIHSANPVGKKNIEMAMMAAERFWFANGKLPLDR